MSSPTSSRLILASASPRRRQLLQQVGYDPLCVSVDVDEQALPGESPAALVQRLASNKAMCFLQHHSQQLCVDDDAREWVILGADTVIDLDGQILGKPGNQQAALHMLNQLSGREHIVVSGVCVLRATGRGLEHLQACEAVCVRTVLRFGEISPSEAADYWKTGEPADKAGAYAIQGMGAQFVAHLSGSYSNVVGLPLFETLALLRGAGMTAGHAM